MLSLVNCCGHDVLSRRQKLVPGVGYAKNLIMRCFWRNEKAELGNVICVVITSES